MTDCLNYLLECYMTDCLNHLLDCYMTDCLNYLLDCYMTFRDRLCAYMDTQLCGAFCFYFTSIR